MLLACAPITRAESLTITFQDYNAPGMDATITVPPPGPDSEGNIAAALSAAYGPISYSVSGSSNPPGTQLTGSFLSTTDIYLRNTSTAAHHIKITFDAFDFTLPSTSPLFIDTAMAASDVSGLDPYHASTLEASSLGGVSFDQTTNVADVGTGYVTTILVANHGTYELKQVYDLWVKKTANGNQISASVQMNVTDPAPAPEPQTLVGLATIVPMGAWYAFFRGRRSRRKEKSVASAMGISLYRNTNVTIDC